MRPSTSWMKSRRRSYEHPEDAGEGAQLVLRHGDLTLDLVPHGDHARGAEFLEPPPGRVVAHLG